MMPQRGASPQGFSLRNARIIWSCFVVAACWFMLIAHFMRHVSPTAPAPAFKWVLLAVGAVDIVVIGAIRRNFLEQSRDKAARGETVAARAAWSVAQMMGFASAMSIVLFGFVLSMMVAGWFQHDLLWGRSSSSRGLPATTRGVIRKKPKASKICAR